ncbi:MAG: hypothetical protein KDA84_29230, partial [Planctomycetaceae bacterium]|nr:hypothetical protein [Planctomycetaceae bacterium]
LAAMVSKGSKTWYFKVMGDEELVETQTKNFDDFIRSLDFADGNAPTWKLPEGWTQESSGGGMRFATLKIPTDSPLELSVMSLPSLGDDYEKYTVDNINRWRGQVNLSPITKANLAEETQEVPTKDGQAIVVDLSGWQEKGKPSMPPFAGGGGPFSGGAPFAGGGGQSRPQAPLRQQPTASGLPELDLPKGWTKTPNKSGLTLASYQLEDGGKQAEVTLIRMGLLPDQLLLVNINRWRGQVNLEPITAGEVQKAMTKIEAGDQTGRYLKLDGPEKAMLVGMLNNAGSTWYIKMLGDTPLVKTKEAEFKKFVQSVRFSAQ